MMPEVAYEQMDFRQLTQPTTPRPAAPAVSSAPEGPEHQETKGRNHKADGWNWLQLFNGIMLIAIAILIALVALAIVRSNSNTAATTGEGAYVNTSKYQAVFLSNGQVYFGNIESLNDTYLRMTDVYYLTQGDTTSASGNYSLVKLGCQQIHNPYDTMIINRSQVTFWENLQDDGKVVSSIKQFQKQNPNGPDCSKVSNQTQADSTTTQGSNPENQ